MTRRDVLKMIGPTLMMLCYHDDITECREKNIGAKSFFAFSVLEQPKEIFQRLSRNFGFDREHIRPVCLEQLPCINDNVSPC